MGKETGQPASAGAVSSGEEYWKTLYGRSCSRRMELLARARAAEIERSMLACQLQQRPAAEDVWKAFAARFDEDGGLGRDAAIEIMRAHGLR